MAANLTKKFELLCCCLMTMQALRLVISTAGFCVVRFHIDCTLFNIFISRLVNAVLMSQLFGNWLGDLIVFAASGPMKMISIALANWAELICFCCALYCLVHSETGHLTGFYWSMVSAYFWWKVGEAPCTSIAVNEADYYFAGFTLSGVWAAMLKAVVMIWCGKDEGIHSDVLGDVNVTVVGDVNVVGARSIKTTVDYRASKWLFAITIVLTILMCLVWEAAQGVREIGLPYVWGEFRRLVETAESATVSNQNNKLVTKIKELSQPTDKVKTNSAERNVTWNSATVDSTGVKGEGGDKIKITVKTTDVSDANEAVQPEDQTTKTTADKLKGQLQGLITLGTISGVVLSGKVNTDGSKFNLTVTVSVSASGWIVEDHAKAVAARTGVALAGIMAVPGALLFSWFGRWCKSDSLKGWVIAGGMLGAVVTAATFGEVAGTRGKEEEWVPSFKWRNVEQDVKKGSGIIAPGGGLAAGLATGALVGLCIGACTGSEKRGTAAGALVGSFFGLWFGEVVTGVLKWVDDASGFNAKGVGENLGQKVAAVCCGFLINVLGLGTVYSVYPGMAPCSITQFKYFNIIDILILILSAIAPLVIMGMDLADVKCKLAYAIGGSSIPGKEEQETARWVWVSLGMVGLIVVIICESIVLDVMQHPFSKTAQKVTTSGWRAVTLTVTMVTSQLTSTGVGFAATAAGSGFNDGIINMNSTAVLWTTECCGVLGEGYLTELKKYEPGKWPTQGMGKWDTYWWWNGKAFGNAWQIWCCIGTTDLRRDIMLCRQ